MTSDRGLLAAHGRATTAVTISGPEPDALQSLQYETRSLLRALLLGSMIEQPENAAAASHALTRLELGTYGACECCAALIPLDALLAAPHTARCHDCSSIAAPRDRRRRLARRRWR